MMEDFVRIRTVKDIVWEMIDANPMAAKMKIMMDPSLLQKNLAALPS